ncbi:MAG: sugar phosphate nucleotidyltransferase, partial [Chthoniobacterales bacterium]
MTKPTLVVLAAGMGSRYGGLKQMDPVGPSGEFVLDYSVFDAVRAGFGKVVFVIRGEFEEVFRESVVSRYAGRIEVELAEQSLDDLPGGYEVPEGREKPWGTGQAIWAARDAVREPFLVVNADDFYGREAFAEMGAWLAESGRDSGIRCSLVAYALRNTVSENGTVSRGICEVDAGGRLVSVEECTEIGSA